MQSTNIPQPAGEDGFVDEIVSAMEGLTYDKMMGPGLGNADANLPLIAAGQGRSLKAMVSQHIGEGESAIVIAAGPSIKRHDPLRVIKETGYKGAIVATESAMRYCLRNGVVPDLVVTVDPRPRILRWFGNRTLSREEIAADNYYGRQDLDSFFADELKANEEVLRLVDEYGPRIKIAMSTSASRAVVDRAFEAGMDVYWWNPMYDDPDQPDSVTLALQKRNGLPSVNAGGNVGAACWMMAQGALGKQRVAITGMDYSYYDGTPLGITQYFQEMCDLVGKDNIAGLFKRIFNPHERAWFFTDPAYYWYREIFMEMVRDGDCETFNCTQGGIVFGDGINYMSLAQFLQSHA